jgi:hypothetical protein
MIKIECSLNIAGSRMDFDEVSECVGSQPSEMISARPKQISWGVPEFTWSLDEHYSGSDERPTGDDSWTYPDAMIPLGRLFDRISSRTTAIREYAEAKGFEVFVVIVVSSDNESLPFLNFPKGALEQLVALGAELQFDIYPGPSDADEK